MLQTLSNVFRLLLYFFLEKKVYRKIAVDRYVIIKDYLAAFLGHKPRFMNYELLLCSLCMFPQDLNNHIRLSPISWISTVLLISSLTAVFSAQPTAVLNLWLTSRHNQNATAACRLRGGGFTGRFADGRLDKFVQKGVQAPEDEGRAALEDRVRAELAARRREQLEATTAPGADDTERAAWARLLGDAAAPTPDGGKPPRRPAGARGASAAETGGGAGPLELRYDPPEWGGRPAVGAPAGRLEIAKAGAPTGPPVELWRWATVPPRRHSRPHATRA
jgi:hypothetical protein